MRHDKLIKDRNDTDTLTSPVSPVGAFQCQHMCTRPFLSGLVAHAMTSSLVVGSCNKEIEQRGEHYALLGISERKGEDLNGSRQREKRRIAKWGLKSNRGDA